MSKFFERINKGLGNTRAKFQEQVNVLLDKGPNLDEEFWEGLEDALISSDVGAPATIEIIDSLRDEAKRKALPDADAVLSLLEDRICEQFAKDEKDVLSGDKALLLFVGINGTGKTTTVGKIAKEASDAGLNVILGSADTFRAAAIEQLEVWANRAGVEMVTRERGSDPASVCYATIERAEELDSDLVLIDTAGRLHTSKDLMAELEKVVKVTRKRSNYPVHVILVIDATTGQNGMTQAKEFNNALDLDGLIITKLDGTAKGGIALAISKELNLPILKIGVGEQIEDLRNFNPKDFAKAFIGYSSDDSSEVEPKEIIDEQPVNISENPQEEQPEEAIEESVEEQQVQNTEDEITDEPVEEPIEQVEQVVKDDLVEESIEEQHLDIEDNEPANEPIEEPEQVQEDDMIEEEPIEQPVQVEEEEIVEEDPKKKKKKGKFRNLFDTLFVD